MCDPGIPDEPESNSNQAASPAVGPGDNPPEARLPAGLSGHAAGGGAGVRQGQPATQGEGAEGEVPALDARPRDELGTFLDRVLQAAMELFGTRGYRGTTLQDIAERCGVSKPTLYKHFRSKADLYEAVVLHVHRQFMTEARRALRSGRTVRVKLVAYLNYQFDFAVRHAPLLKTLHSIMFLPEEVRPQINHSLFAEERFGVLMELLREAAAQGAIRGDPMDVGLAVAGLGSLGVVQALLPSVPILQKGLAERLCNLLFDGIAGPGERDGDEG